MDGRGAGPVDLLLRHGRVITMDPARRILVDGAIAVTDGRITDMGPDREVAPRHTARETRDLRSAVVHPGLVDGHNHTNSRAVRGLFPKDSIDWSPVERATLEGMTPEFEYASAVLACMEMVASGTTIYSDTGGSLFLDQTVAAIETVGMRGVPGWFIVDAPGALGGTWSRAALAQRLQVSTQEGLRRLRDQVDRYPFRRGPGEPSPRARSAVLLMGMLANTEQLVIAAQELARERDLPLIMHKSWSADEVEASLAEHGRRPVERLADIGVLGPNVTLAHAIQLDEHEVELLAAAGASMLRGVGAIRVGRFPEALAAGVNVALGSDGGRGQKHDVARAMYLAVGVHREVRGAFPVITFEQALEMATINGARALGLADELGSIEIGKRADLVVHGLDATEAHPKLRDPVDALVFVMRSGSVESVYVDGEPIYLGRRFTRFDPVVAYETVDRLAAEFEAQIGIGRFSAWPLIE